MAHCQERVGTLAFRLYKKMTPILMPYTGKGALSSWVIGGHTKAQPNSLMLLYQESFVTLPCRSQQMPQGPLFVVYGSGTTMFS